MSETGNRTLSNMKSSMQRQRDVHEKNMQKMRYEKEQQRMNDKIERERLKHEAEMAKMAKEAAKFSGGSSSKGVRGGSVAHGGMVADSSGPDRKYRHDELKGILPRGGTRSSRGQGGINTRGSNGRQYEMPVNRATFMDNSAFSLIQNRIMDNYEGKFYVEAEGLDGQKIRISLETIKKGDKIEIVPRISPTEELMDTSILDKIKDKALAKRLKEIIEKHLKIVSIDDFVAQGDNEVVQKKELAENEKFVLRHPSGDVVMKVFKHDDNFYLIPYLIDGKTKEQNTRLMKLFGEDHSIFNRFNDNIRLLGRAQISIKD